MLKVLNQLLTLNKLSPAKMVNSQSKMMLNYGSIYQIIIHFIPESNLQVTLKSIMIMDYANVKERTGIFTDPSGLINPYQKHLSDWELLHMLKDVNQTTD